VNALLPLLLLAAAAPTETKPVIQPAPAPEHPVATVEMPYLPQPILPVPLDASATHLYPDAKGRPAVYVATDGPRGPLTEGEIAKLAMARARRGAPAGAPAPAAAEIIPGVTPSPAAGVGPDVPVVQEVGPPGLTAAEREKLDAALARARERQPAAPREGE